MLAGARVGRALDEELYAPLTAVSYLEYFEQNQIGNEPFVVYNNVQFIPGVFVYLEI